MGNECGAHTFPYIEAKNKTAQIEHEATTSKIGEDQIFYCNQRGIDTEKAIALIVNGFSKDVLNKLPMEFAVEAQKLLEISLEGSVGSKIIVYEKSNHFIYQLLQHLQACKSEAKKEVTTEDKVDIGEKTAKQNDGSNYAKR